MARNNSNGSGNNDANDEIVLTNSEIQCLHEYFENESVSTTRLPPTTFGQKERKTNEGLEETLLNTEEEEEEQKEKEKDHNAATGNNKTNGKRKRVQPQLISTAISLPEQPQTKTIKVSSSSKPTATIAAAVPFSVSPPLPVASTGLKRQREETASSNATSLSPVLKRAKPSHLMILPTPTTTNVGPPQQSNNVGLSLEDSQPPAINGTANASGATVALYTTDDEVD